MHLSLPSHFYNFTGLTKAHINPKQLTRKHELALKIQHLLACKDFDYLLYSKHIQHLVRSYVAIAISIYMYISYTGNDLSEFWKVA